MENQAKNATAPEHTAARGTVVSDAKGQAQYQSSPLRSKTPLLINVSSAEGAEPSQGILHQLLMTTEASAARTQSAKRKWQLLSLMLAMLLVPAIIVIGWMGVETNTTGTQRGKMEIENQSLKEQLETAGAQVTAFKNEIEMLLSRNIELARENAKLKSQSSSPIATMSAVAVKAVQKSVEPRQAVDVKITAVSENALNASRVEAIRKGSYPSGATKAELIAVMGEPDRTYKSRGYEQLVYFDRKPGRFWLIGNWLVQTTE
jgi:regulator of replication initiation timing